MNQPPRGEGPILLSQFWMRNGCELENSSAALPRVRFQPSKLLSLAAAQGRVRQFKQLHWPAAVHTIAERGSLFGNWPSVTGHSEPSPGLRRSASSRHWPRAAAERLTCPSSSGAAPRLLLLHFQEEAEASDRDLVLYVDFKHSIRTYTPRATPSLPVSFGSPIRRTRRPQPSSPPNC